MSSLLPSRSDGYQVDVNFKVSVEVWNHVFGDVDVRIADLEGIVAAGYTAAQDAGTAMAEAIIANSVAPQIADITGTIAAFNAQLALAEDQLAALQSGGVEAANITVPAYGIYGSGMNAQAAFYHVSDILTLITETALPALDAAKLAKSSKATEGQIDGGTNDETYVTPLGLRTRENKVSHQIGDMLITEQEAPVQPGTWLECDNAKYLKSSYPELGALCAAKYFNYSHQLGNLSTNLPSPNDMGSHNGASYIASVYDGVLDLYRITEDGVVTRVIVGMSAGSPQLGAARIACVGSRLMFLGASTTLIRSSDNGLTWSSTGASLPTLPNALTAYKGYFYAKLYANAGSSVNGIYRSLTGDTGSWERVWPLGGEDTTENRNYASTTGTALVVAGERLFFMTHTNMTQNQLCKTIYSDNGTAWTVVDTPHRDFFIGNNNKGYAELEGEAYQFIRQGPLGEGVYKTNDGLEWQLVTAVGTNGLEAGLTSVSAVASSEDSSVLALYGSLTGIANSRRAYISTPGSGGRVWRLVDIQMSNNDNVMVMGSPVKDLVPYVKRTSASTPETGPIRIASLIDDGDVEFRVPASVSGQGKTFIKAAA